MRNRVLGRNASRGTEEDRSEHGSWLAVLLLLAFLLPACVSNAPVRRYYTLTLPSPPQLADAKFDGELWVREVEIAPTYNRPQVVFRYSPNELRYFTLDHWADRPQRMMTQQVTGHLRGSGLFTSVSERLGTRAPAYVLESTLNAMEQLDGGDIWYAHLAMSFRLTRFDGSQVVWQHSFDERRPISRPDVGLTVRALSEIMDEQMGIAARQIDAALSGRPLPEVHAPTAGVGNGGSGAHVGKSGSSGSTGVGPSASVDETTEVEAGSSSAEGRPQISVSEAPQEDTASVDWRRSEQYTSDPTVVPPGKGALFLPSLSGDPEREPPAQVYQDGELVINGAMGRRIPVAPGRYKVYFGSGTLSQRMMRDVEVGESEIVIVQPNWAALDVSVVDSKFIPFRGSYEIINMLSKEYLGVGYGAEEELGESTQVWILPPGLYKLVQPGANYRARTNFATVQLTEENLASFVLVMDPTSRDFLGAGIAEEEEVSVQGEESWTLRSSFGGDATWHQWKGEGLDVGEGTELAGTLYTDNLLKFKQDPHLWSTRLEIEETQRIASHQVTEDSAPTLDGAEIEAVADRIYLNSLYIYELVGWAGPYVRLGGESKLLNRVRSLNDDQGVLIVDENNEEARVYDSSLRRVKVAGFLSPMEFKEGLGVNFRVAHTTELDLDWRIGLGARQYLARGLLVAVDDPAAEGIDVPASLTNGEKGSISPLVLKPVENSFPFGTETTLVASARFTRYVQATTEFDALIPFNGFNETRFTWRNSISLRLSTFASLIYALDLDRNPVLTEGSPYTLEQSVRLRFFYSPF